MKTVHSLSDQDLPNKPQFVSSLHSCIGNAHLDLDQTQAALTHHMEDLRIAEDKYVVVVVVVVVVIVVVCCCHCCLLLLLEP